MANENIFSGLKVVDLSSFVAGPGAAVILSDFGAAVDQLQSASVADLKKQGFQVK